jgi:hypothetical protein
MDIVRVGQQHRESDVSAVIEQLKARARHREHATDGADVITPRIYPPATAALVDAAEETLGFALPPLLRRIYLEVGNGGFGPGYGLLGVLGGAVDDTGRNIIDLYRMFREPERDDPMWQWPAQLLPICHLGCAMYGCVDCTDPNGAVTWWEPNPREPGDPVDLFLVPVAPSLEAWLWAWLRNEDWMSPAYETSALKRWQDDYDARLDNQRQAVTNGADGGFKQLRLL